MSNPFDISNALSAEPTTITQKAFVHWKKEAILSSDYVTFRYEYRFKHASSKQETFKTVAVDAAGYVSMSPNWAIGEYYWSLYFVRQSDSAAFLVDTGMLTVMPDASSGVDMRPHAKIVLAKLQSVIEGRADSDIAEYEIAGRKVVKMNMTELLKWRDVYSAEVARLQFAEDAANGRRRPRALTVRFTG